MTSPRSISGGSPAVATPRGIMRGPMHDMVSADGKGVFTLRCSRCKAEGRPGLAAISWRRDAAAPWGPWFPCEPKEKK